MNIFRLSFRNMMSRPLSTTLSLLLLTLGVGMIALLLQVNKHIQEQMENNVRGIDMVVGAKGSPLQLILSAVYHIDDPTGNISESEAQQLLKNPLIEFGIPLAYGDSYEGYRIVGTDHDYPDLFQASLSSGRLWESAFEVTIGKSVAAKLNLDTGDTFTGSHGLLAGGEAHDDHPYTVVGVFEYSNSVLDQLILTPTESIWDAHGHEGDLEEHHDDKEPEAHKSANDQLANHEDHHDREEGEDRKHPDDDHGVHEDLEITAILVKFRSPMGMVRIPRMVNEETSMQAAVPAYEISRLFGLMGVGVDTLTAIALVIMAVSGLSVFISLYSALKERQYEMSLMRTYGATRWQLVWLVLQEGLLLTFFGFVLGIFFSRFGLWLVYSMMEASYHYEFSGWIWLKEELWLMVITLGIGLVAALIPAIRVFKINISKTLAHA